MPLSIRRARRALMLGCVAVLSLGSVAHADVCGTHWVGAWAGVPSDASRTNDISDAFAPSPDFPPGSAGDAKQPVDNASVRAILTPSVGGSVVRVRLSNRFGSSPATFAHTTLAKQAKGPEVTATPVGVAFGGKPSVTVSAGRDVLSDPVAFSYTAFDNLAVSVYVSGNVGKPTEHYQARQYSFFTTNGAGDHTAEKDGGAYSLGNTTRPLVTGIDVQVQAPLGAVVAFGDSITDGYQGQAPAGFPENPEGVDANGRYPDVLGRRLRAGGLPLSVINAGISGNRVLRDGTEGGGPDSFGPAALKRLEADVLDQPGATTVIWLEGINDLGQKPKPAVEQVLDGYRVGIARMHAAGLRVLLGTLTPSGGAANDYGTAETEAKRQEINAWIRTRSPADGVIDFDAAVRDPNVPTRIAPQFDGSDHLHFNLAGYKRMGESVDLAQLKLPSCPAVKRLTFRVSKRHLTRRVASLLRVVVRQDGVPVRGAVVRLGRFAAKTNAAGVARLRVRFAKPALRMMTVIGLDGSRASVRVRIRRHARRHG